MSNISVIGAGYVGLVTAACFAELGHRVRVVEISHAKLNALRYGELPLSEPGLPELWQRNWLSGRLRVTGDYAEGMAGAEICIIAVGTPSARNGKPDLSWVRSAAKSIAQAADGPTIVAIKSTVPVGTAELIAGMLSKYARDGRRFPVVSNPEFLREGLAVFDFMHPNRVVVGASDGGAAEAVARLYRPLGSPMVLCDSRTAEMSKYACNVFLATRISFMNELARLCDKCDADIGQVAQIMGMDTRFGKGYLSAGLGWGGSCLPKDVRGLIHTAKRHGLRLPLASAVQQINETQPSLVVDKLCRLAGGLEGRTIGVLGLTFKPNCDDIREASSLTLIRLLLERGARVKAYDPQAMASVATLLPDIAYCPNAYEVARGSDAIILVTEWDEFRKLDMALVRSLMHRPVLVDGRNLYDPAVMARAGFIYEGMGRTAKTATELESMPCADGLAPADSDQTTASKWPRILTHS